MRGLSASGCELAVLMLRLGLWCVWYGASWRLDCSGGSK
jgi:hypothetical protein